MGYIHKQEAGVDIIQLEDEVDLYSVPDLKKFCKELLLETDTKKILFTMETLRFIDSSGLAMLVNLLHECKRIGIKLKLANLSSEAEKTFHLTKLHSDFDIFSTVDEAIHSFG